jgi:hypothetical protein
MVEKSHPNREFLMLIGLCEFENCVGLFSRESPESIVRTSTDVNLILINGTSVLLTIIMSTPSVRSDMTSHRRRECLLKEPTKTRSSILPFLTAQPRRADLGFDLIGHPNCIRKGWQLYRFHWCIIRLSSDGRELAIVRWTRV